MTAAAKIQAEHATFSAAVNARDLLATLKLVLTTARPSVSEVLTRVFVEQSKSGLMLASTNLLNTTRATVARTSWSGVGAAHIHVAGLLAFTEIAARNADAEVSLSFDRGMLTMGCGRRKLRVAAGYGEDYPTLPAPLKRTPLKIGRRVLLALLSDAHRFASKDDLRPHLNGVLVKRVDNALHVVATDGHRLVKLTHEMPGSDEPAFEALIPFKSVALWIRALKSSCLDEVELRKDSCHVELRAGRREVVSKLIDATFPPYEVVIPKTWGHEITLPRDVLTDAARVALAMRGSDTMPALVFSSDGKGFLKLTSRNPDEGELEEAIEYDGPAFRLGVHARYLLDALRLGRDPRVSLRVSGELDPVSVVNERANAVVMPMRV